MSRMRDPRHGARQVRSVDGTTISYLSVGAGPAVVVLPGVLSLARDYGRFANTLGESFTVHTLERRGRGASGPQGPSYSIAKECEDVLAVCAHTDARLLVGHSYGGLVALEVARNSTSFDKIAVYEPGVSIEHSMGIDWLPEYERDVAAGKRLNALARFTLADAPSRLQKMPSWAMKFLLLGLFVRHPSSRQMLDLLEQNGREWREIDALDDSYMHYSEILASVLLMYGGSSDSHAVDLVAERLPAFVPRIESKVFPGLDHFGIERTAPREVARAVSEYFRRPDLSEHQEAAR